MDTTTNIRRKNLRALVKNIGGLSRFAKKLSKSKSQISQLTSNSASRGIGSNLAREIEIKLDLKLGWMDTLHDQYYDDILEKWAKLPDGLKSQIEGYIDWQLEIMEDEADTDDDEDTDFSVIWKNKPDE
jgi:hypothetical protein